MHFYSGLSTVCKAFIFSFSNYFFFSCACIVHVQKKVENTNIIIVLLLTLCGKLLSFHILIDLVIALFALLVYHIKTLKIMIDLVPVYLFSKPKHLNSYSNIFIVYVYTVKYIKKC